MWPNGEILYVAATCILGSLILIRTVYWLRRSTQKRKEVLASRPRFHAVHGQTREEEVEQIARDRSISNIENQFTVTRRLVIPLVIGLTAVAVSVPFISSTPGAFVSMMVAAVTVIVGIAVKPMVENAIAGLVISFSKLINIGDVLLIDNHYGTVEDITPTHTTIKIWDWRRYVLPNSQMIESKFVNYSLYDRDVWAHVEFWISYDADIDEISEVAIEATKKSKYASDQEPPAFWVMEMGKESVRCWVAGWTSCAADAWMLTHDVRTELVRQFRARGIAAHGYRHAFAAQNGGADLNNHVSAAGPALWMQGEPAAHARGEVP